MGVTKLACKGRDGMGNIAKEVLEAIAPTIVEAQGRGVGVVARGKERVAWLISFRAGVMSLGARSWELVGHGRLTSSTSTQPRPPLPRLSPPPPIPSSYFKALSLVHSPRSRFKALSLPSACYPVTVKMYFSSDWFAAVLWAVMLAIALPNKPTDA